MNKVLIVTYYWPPAGGIAVQRIVKFCKYLPDFNWQPIILTVTRGSYLQLDNSYLKDIDRIQNVYQANAMEPHWFYNRIKSSAIKLADKKRVHTRKESNQVFDWFADFIRLNLFIPDARIGWYPKAVAAGLKVIAQEKPVLIFSTAPPFTSHLVAKKLQAATGLPWIADFRDAWLENNLYDKPYRFAPARYLNKRLENSVLDKANKVVCIGENMKRLLASKVSSSQQEKFHVITNGFDRDDVASITNPSEFFYISYFGTLYRERLPIQLLAAMRDAINRDNSLKEDFRFRIFGNIDNNCLDLIREYLPENNLIVNRPVAYQEFMQQLQTPQVLLLTIDNVPHNELIITGKIFDYMTSGNPIIGVGPTEGDAAIVLRDTQAGKMFDYHADNIVNNILEQYQLWQTNSLKRDINHFSQFERKQLTEQLAKLFNNTKSV